MMAAMLMTLVVEVVTLKGDIGRMNTVFKFYLQSWVMFAVASASGLILILDQLVPQRAVAPTEPVADHVQPAASWGAGGRLWWGAFALLLVAGFLYPVFSTWAKVNDRYVNEMPKSLNGMDYMREATYSENNHDLALREDYDAINWIRENIKGSPVMLDTFNRGLYHWDNRISIYTGLPTIMGWDWHTKQQYSLLPGDIIDHRVQDVRTIYDTPDPNEALELLRHYQVSYVYVGGLERAVFSPEGVGKFEAMAQTGALSKVYDANNVQIYQVNAPGTAMVP
jgi:uncharacterized membrane protein